MKGQQSLLAFNRGIVSRLALARLLRQQQALADWQANPPPREGWLAAASDAEPPPDPEEESPDEP